MIVQFINIALLCLKFTQTRASVRQHVVDEYAERIASGEKMDPVVAFDDGDQIHLSVGFHRYWAHQKLGRTEILCELRKGTVWDAIEHGIMDNRQHRGERVSKADKIHNVRLVLKQKPQLSNSAIATLCDVSDKTVDKYRRELEATSEIPKSEARVGRDGREIRTSKIQRKRRIPADWVPPKFARMSLEDRQTCATLYSEAFLPVVLFLAEVGWEVERIAEFFGVPETFVIPILHPNPQIREVGEFETISSKPQLLMTWYGDVVKRRIHQILYTQYLFAICEASSEGFSDVAGALEAKARDHKARSEECRESTWPGSYAKEFLEICTALDACAATDARIALGIELSDECLERSCMPLASNFEYYKANQSDWLYQSCSRRVARQGSTAS